MSEAGGPLAVVGASDEVPRKFRLISMRLWLLSAVGLLAFMFFGPDLSEPATLLAWIASMCVVVGLNGMFLFMLVSSFRLAFQQQDVMASVRAGEYDAARRHIEKLLPSIRMIGLGAPELALALGAVEVESGRFARGLAILEAARASRWFDWPPSRRNRGPLWGSIAFAHAMLGDATAAEQALGQARRDATGRQRGQLLLDEAVVLARLGRGRELADSVAQHLAAAEDILPLWSLRVILVLRELAARGDAAPGYRESAEDTTRDRLADPKVRMWLSRLAPSWSELQTFLAGHGIVAEPEARALRDAEDSASSSERA
jgi:hypothetical protein